MKVPRFRAFISLQGVIRLDAETRKEMDRALQDRAGKPIEIELHDYEETRSSKANRYYWGVVLALLSEDTGIHKDELHELMCERFLTKKTVEIVNRNTGEAEEHTITGRSSKLKIGDFYHFVERVREFALDFFNVRTPDPDPEYWRRNDAA